MTAAASNGKTGRKASGGWLVEQTQALMDAARAGQDDRVYALAAEVAERTTQQVPLYALVRDYAVQRRHWGEAVRFSVLQLRTGPSDRKTTLDHARLLRDAGAHDLAQEALDRLAREDPAATDVLRSRIETLIAGRRTGTLADEIRAVLATDGITSSNLHETAAQLLINDGRLELAGEILDEAEVRFGETRGLLRQRAVLAYRRGALEEAEARWLAIAASEPSSQRTATIFRARVALEADDRSKADELYRAVLRLEPGNLEATRYVVRHAIRRGALDEADARIADFRRTGGEEAEALWYDALLLVARRDVPGALALGMSALRLSPRDASLALRIADLHSDTGDWSGAAGVLDTALERFPHDFALLGRKARAAENLGTSPAETLAIVERGLALRPNDESMLRSRANLLGRLGQRRQAVAAAIAALDHHPGKIAFWRIAIAGLLNLSEPGEAYDLVERARGVFAGDTPADALALVEILEVAELHDEAYPAARRLVSLAPDDPRARLIAARIAVARGLYREAMPDLEAMQALTDRAGPDAALRARVATALSYVEANPLQGVTDNVFPDAILHRIAALSPARAWEDCEPVVAQVTAGLGAGGAERQLTLTLRGQARRAEADASAMRPVLLAGDLNPLTARDFFLRDVLDAGVEVVELSQRRAEGSVRDLMAADLSHRRNVAILGALPPEMGALALPLYAELAAMRPRVVHLWQDTTSIAGALAAVLAGVPRIVIGTRSTRPVERQRARPWLAAGYEALMARPGVTVINNSRNGALDYEDWLGLPSDTVLPLYNGYEFGAMRARATPELIAQARARIGAQPETPVFGGVMRLSFEKRPELWTATAIALAEELPDLRCVLVGEGPMAAQLLDMVAARGLSGRIHFVGRQAPVEPWMQAMDVLFLSSLTEGLPNVLIEAQSLGVAVASMRVGGAPETMIAGETGLLIDEGTPAEIATKIAPLLRDPELRARFGSAAVRWTEDNFSDHAMLDRLDEIYQAGRA